MLICESDSQVTSNLISKDTSNMRSILGGLSDLKFYIQRQSVSTKITIEFSYNLQTGEI
jgi:hypothetical protein